MHWHVLATNALEWLDWVQVVSLQTGPDQHKPIYLPQAECVFVEGCSSTVQRLTNHKTKLSSVQSLHHMIVVPREQSCLSLFAQETTRRKHTRSTAYIHEWNPEEADNAHHGKSAQNDLGISLEEQKVPPFCTPAVYV